ncbi:bifunctional heptose 7-phosphate kinase/heptose 1-phosphate adenyltransferase [Roseateles violae]|uniref:PfkB family carbohydrate kinase n=1 Tax=Roseateles violae TaxID=3058042 RepID=A0ABT8DW66_9BURK|nr:PfkB family carbohydrate kinase [Pelomonas sp. PFR6]MDN3922341.1 PfkB family carbohydrate kinase [Pelomonas sp. PFR6]
MRDHPPSDAVLVLGDSMLDRYLEGSVERISPEAPVPVLLMGSEWQRAGGAANVAINLIDLHCPVTLATLLGQDEAGGRLAELLIARGVELQAVRGTQICTTQKIRVVCRRQQLLRIDIEQPAPGDSAQALAELAAELLPRYRWLLLSDYGKGALSDCRALIDGARRSGCRVLVDPKGRDFVRYRGAWLLKPNAEEAAQAAGAWSDEADFERRMGALRQQLELEHLLVTRGELGMVLFSPGRAPLRIAAQAREVYDVSGAGDTVLAVLARALAGGRGIEEAARQANRAAGLVVQKFGTASLRPEELDGAAAPPSLDPLPPHQESRHDEYRH